jgi:hypothetical protein
MLKTSNMVYKTLVFGVIVLFIGMSVPSNAVNIQKDTLLDKETTGEYKLNVIIFVMMADPQLPPILFSKTVVTHENNSSFKIVVNNWFPCFSILIPEIYKYPDVNVYSLGYEQMYTHYPSYNKIHIYIRWAGFPRTLNDPFINRLPILNQLLQLWLR